MQLEPRNALALALALHELCTNAAKYGAPSVPGGHITITWHIEPSATGDDLLALRWAERGGPPVTPTARKGFGKRLVESSLAGELGADVQIVYHFDGVVCTMRARLQRLQQDISPMAAP